MKQWLFFLLFLLIGFPARICAQLQPVASSIHTITARINLVENQLERAGGTLALLEGGEAFETDMLLDSLAIRSGELAVFYHLPVRDFPRRWFDKAGEKLAFAYDIGLVLELNGEALVPEPPCLIGDIGEGIMLREGTNTFRITWARLLPDYINLEGNLKVSLQVEEKSNLLNLRGINCGNAPAFSFDQRLPYFLAGGVGAGLVLAGVLEEAHSRDIYNNDYENAENYRQSLGLYNKANDKHHNFLIFTTAGAAILLTDAVLYYRRTRNYRNDKRIFRQFCPEENLAVRPVLQLPAGQYGSGQLGLHLAYTF